MVLKERSNIILVESEDDNMTIAAEPMDEFNGDWIRALRAQREGDTDKIKNMHENQTVVAND